MVSLMTTEEAEGNIWDETLFQPQPPQTTEYKELATRFERDVWTPIAPFAKHVL